MVLRTLALGAAAVGAGYLFGKGGKNKGQGKSDQSRKNKGKDNSSQIIEDKGYYGGYTYHCYHGKLIFIE